MKKVIVRTVPGPGETKVKTLGQMIDKEDGSAPVGTTELAEEMLARDPRERFDYYAAGWSNGYVETKAA